MASSRITCPDCKSVLKPAKPVPDGKKVKCPKCGQMFTTPGLVEDEDRPRKKAAGQKAKAAIKKAPRPEPPPKKASHDDEDEEGGGGIYGYIPEEEKEEEDKPKIVYAPDMSIKDLRGPAQELLVRPSNYMLLIGGLCCLSNIFIICFCFWPMVFSDSPVNWEAVLTKHYGDKGDKSGVEKIKNYKERSELKDEDQRIVEEAEEAEVIWRWIAMGVYFLLLIYNGIAIIGAVKMQNMESRRWAIASSIMILLPMGAAGLGSLVGGGFYYTVGSFLDEMNLYYSIGLALLPCLLGLVVGVWSLRVLMSQQVIDGFEYVAD